jgi:hypothetical protein
MKIVSLVLLCATLLTLSPAYGQGRRSRVKPSGAAPAAAAAEEAPKTGVRFVICSPAGTTMPSPLYVQTGDNTFKAINIGARTPSMRVKPIGGVVKFWDKDPSAEALGEEDKKKKPAGKAALPEPIFSVSAPSGKVVCILTPNKDVAKTQALFLKESDFPNKGMHVINLSSYPLQITTSESGDFKDKKESKIGVYRREDGISSSNSWSFKGEKGQQVSFILSYADQKTKSYKRIKSSTFVLSDRQSVVNVVVKDPTRNMPKLMTIQLAETK